MRRYIEVDLHGVALDSGRVLYLISEAGQRAQREHVGLRIIHGRGEHKMADLVQQLLREREIEFEEGVLNPGETRVEMLVVQRTRWNTR